MQRGNKINTAKHTVSVSLPVFLIPLHTLPIRNLQSYFIFSAKKSLFLCKYILFPPYNIG